LKKSIVHIFVALSCVSIALAGCISVNGNEDEQTNVKATDSTVVSEAKETPQKEIIYTDGATYHVKSIPLPEGVNFAGEPTPVKNVFVREALDKEFLGNAYWHSNTFKYIKNANRWFPVIEPILKEHNIPDDFKYLAVIESGLLNATSPSGAKGVWQFMPATARGYGMELSKDVEERYDIESSTHAACKYLQAAYDKFGNWTLAAASYNMGKGGLNNQLTKQHVDNYYDLLLNVETGRYIYRMIAVKYILQTPADYGFVLEASDLYPPYQTTDITIDSSISNIVEFAIAQNTNYNTLKRLNPWLKTNKLDNPKGKTYTIKLPVSNTGLDMIAPTTPVVSLEKEKDSKSPISKKSKH